MSGPSGKALSTAEETVHNRLRWIADSYEQAQRVRIQTGERLRAVLQGRDDSRIPGVSVSGDESLATAGEQSADQVLKAIRKGTTDGPVPLLGRSYRHHWYAEQELQKGFREYLEQHPTWPWLQHVKGVGFTLAGKLIARLDPTKADTASGFWAYCGLATVPGVEYRCAECGYIAAFPPYYKVSGSHPRLNSKRACKGQLLRARGPEDGVRVAQPKPVRGEQIGYDAYAKKVCYLIGTSFLKTGGPYEKYYRRERGKLDHEKCGWMDGRKHLTALRKTEKLFLAHLWLVWREALNLPVTQPYSQAVQGHEGFIGPWEMVKAEGLGEEGRGSAVTAVAIKAPRRADRRTVSI